MIPPAPLACTELFFLNLHVIPLSPLIPGQLWLLSSPLAGQTCVRQAGSIQTWKLLIKPATTRKRKGLPFVHLAKLD